MRWQHYTTGKHFQNLVHPEQLNKNHVCKSDPVTMPHEMSSWVNFPKGRLT